MPQIDASITMPIMPQIDASIQLFCESCNQSLGNVLKYTYIDTHVIGEGEGPSPDYVGYFCINIFAPFEIYKQLALIQIELESIAYSVGFDELFLEMADRVLAYNLRPDNPLRDLNLALELQLILSEVDR